MSFYLILALILFGYMNLWFIASLVKQRNDVADVAWGLGFVLLAWAAFFLSDEPGGRGLLVSILVSIWGLRLAWHIGSRHRGKAEDARYRAWRLEWGKWFLPRSYAQVFLLQGALLFVVALPVMMINRYGATPLALLDWVGICVFGFGLGFEAISDAQLTRFLRNPKNKGKLMQSGLWRFSRHPNYFGEVTLWWGLWLLAVQLPYGVFTIIGPLTITILIMFVSGIPLLEKKYAGREDFELYKKQTSIFFPLPPKPL